MLYICIASILFSIQPAFTKQYQKNAGEGLKSSFIYNATSPLLFIAIMFFYEGMKLDFTLYSFVMAMIWAVICNAMSFFQIKALSSGNVANYSLFLLGGGMIIPVVYGAIFGDDFGAFKITGVILVCIAVLIKINPKEKGEKGSLFSLIAIFLLNGLAGVLSSVYQSELIKFDKISSEQFSILRSFTTVGVGAVMLGVLSVTEKGEGDENARLIRKGYLKAMPWSLTGGGINGVANLLLLFALQTVQPSLQYPIITGGGILLSAIVGLIFKEIPDKKTWISVGFATAGTIIMIF